MTSEKLTDGEVTGGSVTTDVFPILSRTYRYPQFAQRITRASLPTSMATRWLRVVVLQPSLVMAWPSKHGYDIYKP